MHAPCLLVVRGRETVPDPYPPPLAAFGLVHGGHHHTCPVLVDHPLDGRDDLLRPVGVDEFHDRFQVRRRGVLFGVLLHLTPGREQEQLVMRGPPPSLQIDRRLGDCQQRLAAPGQRNRHPGLEEAQHLSERVRVAPAQHRIGDLGLPQPGGPAGVPGQLHRRGGGPQPPVRHLRDRRTEPERLRQLQPLPRKPAHDVLGVPPLVDLLRRIPDTHPLRVLRQKDFLQHRVGVLRLVQQHEVRPQPRPRQRPHLQVVVVLERQLPGGRADVLPRPASPLQQHLRQILRPLFVQPVHRPQMPGRYLFVRAVAKMPDHLHHEPRQRRRLQPSLAHRQVPIQTQQLRRALERHMARGVETILKPAAYRAVRQ